MTNEKLIAPVKSASAERGLKEAAAAFVTYDGATADLNALAIYVTKLERFAAALSAQAAQPVGLPGVNEAIAAFQAASQPVSSPTTGGWISVDERMPEPDHRVLTFESFYREFDVASHFGGAWLNDNGGLHVTHWQHLPLPPAPQGKED